MPYDGCMFRPRRQTPPPVGQPRRNRSKNKAQRQARKRRR